MIPPLSPFSTAQQAILNAAELRFVPPEGPWDKSGSDVQGRYENRDGKSFWITLCTFPEAPSILAPLNLPELFKKPDLGFNPSGPFGLKGTNEWR